MRRRKAATSPRRLAASPRRQPSGRRTESSGCAAARRFTGTPARRWPRDDAAETRECADGRVEERQEDVGLLEENRSGVCHNGLCRHGPRAWRKGAECTVRIAVVAGPSQPVTDGYPHLAPRYAGCTYRAEGEKRLSQGRQVQQLDMGQDRNGSTGLWNFCCVLELLSLYAPHMPNPDARVS